MTKLDPKTEFLESGLFEKEAIPELGHSYQRDEKRRKKLSIPQYDEGGGPDESLKHMHGIEAGRR
jgi:hypothetical protein